eukprot:CAMPEP_0168694298 /NCGR_PEP_ID=MMETSP0503-20121227/34224_1 /TAXON_ID=89963 /ORGANISM="Heterocapsa rotundata, Strain SCCAP K-0483" /LENGTH=38 /DNA_ID= /DNA_START= /DNA_END= /DNA_ORIENTATION=
MGAIRENRASVAAGPCGLSGQSLGQFFAARSSSRAQHA